MGVLMRLEDLITQTQAGKLRGVSRTTIHNYVLNGQLNSIKIGDKIFVSRKEISRLKIRYTVRTDEELLADVRRVAKKLKRLPNSAEYKKHGSIHLSSVCKRFGSWANVIEAIRRDNA